MQTPTPQTLSTCTCFIPAQYRGIYASEAEALRATRFDAKRLAQMQVVPLCDGGQLYQELHSAFVILATRSGGYELWLTGTGLYRPTRSEAETAIREFEAVQGEGNWRVFALA